MNAGNSADDRDSDDPKHTTPPFDDILVGRIPDSWFYNPIPPRESILKDNIIAVMSSIMIGAGKSFVRELLFHPYNI